MRDFPFKPNDLIVQKSWGFTWWQGSTYEGDVVIILELFCFLETRRTFGGTETMVYPACRIRALDSQGNYIESINDVEHWSGAWSLLCRPSEL